MDHGESEQFLERIEVSIAVEQRMLLADAIGGDKNVDGLAGRSSALPQPSIVVCRFRGERNVDEIDDFELEELRLDRRRFAVVVKACK